MTAINEIQNEMNGLMRRMRATIRDQQNEIELARVDSETLQVEVDRLTSERAKLQRENVELASHREALLRLANEAREALALALVTLSPNYPFDTDPRFQNIADAYDQTHFPLGDDVSISDLIALLPNHEAEAWEAKTRASNI